MAYSQNSFHPAGIRCLRAVPFVVAHLATTVASLAYTSVGNLSDRLYGGFAETDNVSLAVLVGALHFLARSVVVEVAFVALRKATHIRLCWEGVSRNSSRYNSSIYCN